MQQVTRPGIMDGSRWTIWSVVCLISSVAYCHALLNIFGSTARLTMGLRKERGQWLVAHEHHSYPLE